MNTEIEITAAELKPLLPGFNKIVRKHSLPILRALKVSLDPDGNVRLQAHNLDESVTVRLETRCEGAPGQMIVLLEDLAQVVRHCGDSVRLIQEGKEARLRYRAAGTVLERALTSFEAAEWPPAWDIHGTVEPLDDAFKEALQEALECAGSDATRHVLQGACLDVSRPEAHYVVGTDGHQLYAANSFRFGLASSLIVPARKFLAWADFRKDGPWKLTFQPPGEKQTALFRIESDHWTYVARPVDDVYPNWRAAVPEPDATWTRITLGEAGVQTMLEAIPALPGGTDFNHAVVLEIRSGKLALKARGQSEEAWSDVAVEAQVEGPAVETSLDRRLLAKALRLGVTRIEIKDPVSPVLCNAGSKTFVVMPLRGEAAEKFLAAHPPRHSSAPSPADEPVTPAEPERRTMPENTMTAPERGSLNGHPPADAGEENSPIAEMIEQVGSIKAGLKEALDGLAQAEKLLRKAEKEKRATEKEIGRARSALRSLQSVEL